MKNANTLNKPVLHYGGEITSDYKMLLKSNRIHIYRYNIVLQRRTIGIHGVKRVQPYNTIVN